MFFFIQTIWTIFQLAYAVFAIASLFKVFKFEKRIADDPTQLYTVAARVIWSVGVILWPYWVISKKELVRRVMTYSYMFDDDAIGRGLFQARNWVNIGK